MYLTQVLRKKVVCFSSYFKLLLKHDNNKLLLLLLIVLVIIPIINNEKSRLFILQYCMNCFYTVQMPLKLFISFNADCLLLPINVATLPINIKFN